HAVCNYRLGRYHDAVVSLSTCIGAAPRVSEFRAARALAWAALGRADQALEDHAWARRLAAPDPGPPAAAVHFNLAVAFLGQGDPTAARTHLEQALRDDPQHNAAAELLRQLSRGKP